MKIETKLMHAGEPRIHGAVSMPVFQSSTYTYEGGADYDDIRYIRLNNTPNHLALHAKLAAIDGAEAGLVTASGMAAITTTLVSVAKAGDHMLVQRGLYGGSFTFIRDEFQRLGISYTVVDATNPATWEAAAREDTVAFYLETLTNPTIEVANLVEAARFCRARGITSIVDNTFATPINFRPIEHGIEIVVQSATKYLNGHSDIVAGAITGSAAWIDRLRHALNHWGGTLDPHACVLLQRGMKTLALRVRQQNATAAALAQALTENRAVTRVAYPSLPSHPQYDYAREHFEGFGGVLSFELAHEADPARFLRALKLFIPAPSLGGTESLVVLPAASSHAGLTPAERAELGISDRLIRLAVGIEATEDLVDDVEQAIRAAS